MNWPAKLVELPPTVSVDATVDLTGRAVEVVARRTLARLATSQLPPWEAEFGDEVLEGDWAAVADQVAALGRHQDPADDEVEAAYAHLKARAEQWGGS